MPVFEYRALDPNGEAVSGTLVSASLTGAVDSLSQRGLNVEHVGLATSIGDPLSSAGVARRQETPEAGGVAVQTDGGNPHHVVSPIESPRDITSERSYWKTHLVGPLINKIPLGQLQFFFRQLATMQHAGVGLVQSIDTLSGQTRDPRFRSIVLELGQHVREGRPMSAGLQRYPEVFSPIVLSLVRAGEEAGILEQALRQIADYLQTEIEIRNLVRRLTIYPKLVLFASMVIVIATNMIIASLGKSGGLSSPLTNPITWVFLGPFIIAVFLFFRVGLMNPRIKYNWDAFLLAIPFIGTTVKQLAMAKFGRAFGALYRGGVNIPKSFLLAADACGNEYLRARMYPAALKLEQGAGVTATFIETGAFSPIVLDMTRTGEMTGNLDAMLENMAQFYEDDAAVRSTQMAWLLSVLLLLGVGVYVGYMIISFYVGHFSGITQQLQ